MKKPWRTILVFAGFVAFWACESKSPEESTASVPSGEGIDRTVLPIVEPARPSYSELDVRNATPPPRFEVKAPKGAPNVLVILIDDMGFGVSEAFGGPVSMPNMAKLAQNGLRYNRFHTTALCAPTRAALLTGYNHHSNNMGVITELASTYPGYTSVRPQSITPLAEVLRQNGFNTAQFGKCHEVPPWELSASGPQDRWPTRSGFEKFYGFLGGETNQWQPLIYDGVTQVETPDDPDYHFTTDMTNQAISWMNFTNALNPEKPFFMYYAPGATHAPHHAPKDFIAKYKGKFDQGWDKLREETLARQKQMGIVPANTQLAPKPKEIKDWDALSSDEKKLFTRQMEVYAGFAEHTDYEIGRLITSLEEMGELDNTMIVFIAGDNGSSAEGQMNGMFSEMTYFNQVPETVEDMLKHYDEWGSANTYPHMAAGWAVATDVPFTWTKQVASDFGGTRNGMIIHWPKGIKAKGEIRSQFGHVIDIAPTVYEVTGVPAPRLVNGIAQDPVEGTSLSYSFNEAGAAEKHTVQYFEMFGNRAIYQDGWYARTIHKAPYLAQPYATLQEDQWELFNTLEDFSLSNNLAAKDPEKLKAMQDLFMAEAQKYHALPLDDRTIERMSASAVGRPTIMEGRNSVTYGEGMRGMGVDVFIDLRNTAYTMTAEVEVGANANGVIVCQGGKFGGLSFYVKNGKPTFSYNFLGLQTTTLASNQTLKPGRYTLVYDFKYDGGGPGKGGVGTFLINGEKAGEGRLEKTQPGIFSVDDLADVGIDEGPWVADYGASSKFSGKIKKVTIETKK
ncbi:arylsulfatase [Algoriphagus sp. AK58]|uniref:arylsulfatase n=1 Tax=Algoriphagus sp. AK58 TaxID=1406877 RepID=UPI00164FD641|nr:arylsulfatase [Algoriphagus sp. AK58]